MTRFYLGGTPNEINFYTTRRDATVGGPIRFRAGSEAEAERLMAEDPFVPV